jgi:hypothetical protein
MSLNSTPLLVFVTKTQCALRGMNCIFTHNLNGLKCSLDYSCKAAIVNVCYIQYTYK